MKPTIETQEILKKMRIKEPDTVFVPLFGKHLKRAIMLGKEITERHYCDSNGLDRCNLCVEVPIDIIVENAYREL